MISPFRIFTRWSDLRDPRVLKILTTTAVFAAPFAPALHLRGPRLSARRRSGLGQVAAIVASFKLANRTSRLATVSHYAAVHLRTIFRLRVDAVIHNPLHDLFLERADADEPRDCITYVGRLHPCKRLDRIFPAICALVKETPNLRACIIGDGELRRALEAAAGGNSRMEFTGPLPPEQVRAWLRRTRVFVSGCETEALGIAYLEALSQGCVVAMPACGGALKIAPELIGRSIRLMPLSLEQREVLPVLREALSSPGCAPSLNSYDGAATAAGYLELDRRRQLQQLAAVCGMAVKG